MTNYDVSLEEDLAIILNVNFLLASILFPLIVYLIIFKSAQIGKYKYYLLNNII